MAKELPLFFWYFLGAATLSCLGVPDPLHSSAASLQGRLSNFFPALLRCN